MKKYCPDVECTLIWVFAVLQLTEDATAGLSDDSAEYSDRERAVRLLRDSLCDAKVALTKSLTKSLDGGIVREPASDVVCSRSMESALERYSEQLSSRALQLFKEKLDEQMPLAVTKL